MWRILAALVAVGLSCCNGVSGKEELSNRPRGVRPQLAPLYAEKEEFQCLDGSKKIPYAHMNDDYCDCADGSDEPGTSACPNGRFYCPNRGFRPQELPASMVNDMICDCCDGSDEWDTDVNCPNVCDSLGAEAREAAKKQRAVYEAGWAKRAELAKQGAKALEEKKSELGKLKKELEELQPLKSSTEETKSAAEAKEQEAKDKEDNAWNAVQEEKKKAKARELFDRLDENKDGKLTIADLQMHTEFDGDLDGQISEEETKSYLGDTGEADFDSFYSSAYSQVKDLFNKPAPRVEKVDEPQKETKETATEPPQKEATEEHPDEESDEGEEGDDEFPHDDIAPEPHVEKAEDEEQKPPYSAETQALIDEAEKARKAWRDALDKINELETTIKDSESFLEFEYGPDHAWAPLKGQCPELNEGQYTYKLCLFEKATQKDKNGYSEVNLGHWQSWAGPESDKHAAQKYDHGQSCWNGPDRSTHVEIECGEETQLVEASEPAKCEYRFKLLSPAACTDPAKLDEPYHTEL